MRPALSMVPEEKALPKPASLSLILGPSMNRGCSTGMNLEGFFSYTGMNLDGVFFSLTSTKGIRLPYTIHRR